jgi:hypothetical protein
MVLKLATSITPKEMKSLNYAASKLKKRYLPPSNDKSPPPYRGGGGGGPVKQYESFNKNSMPVSTIGLRVGSI